jgi:DDE superfamily endonuclease
VEAAQVCAGPPGPLLAAGKRGLKRGLQGKKRTVVLFTDATIITETPPLWARWAHQGEPVAVPIMGNRNKRVLYGALNIKTGAICLGQAQKWDQDSFQGHLKQVKAQWRGWNIVLFLDRGSLHTAKSGAFEEGRRLVRYLLVGYLEQQDVLLYFNMAYG